MNKKGIAIAGIIVVDVGFEIDGYPRKGNLSKISDQILSTGGASNISIDLARLDKELPIKISGIVGDDEHGQFIRERLGVYPNINQNQMHHRGRTSTTYVMTERDTKERTFFFDPGSSAGYSIDDVDFAALDTDFLVLEYLLSLEHLDQPHEVYGTNSGEFLAKAQAKGIRTFVDVISEENPERYETLVKPALKYVDCIIINEVEAGFLVGESLDENGVIDQAKMYDALELIRQMGVSTWVVVHSPSFAFGLDCQTGEKFTIPTSKLPEGFIQGTVGAGDAFAAGVVYAAYIGKPIEEALRAGVQCASRSLSKPDSNSGVVDYHTMMNELI